MECLFSKLTVGDSQARIFGKSDEAVPTQVESEYLDPNLFVQMIGEPARFNQIPLLVLLI